MPKVSVAILTRNRPKLLMRAVNDVLRQTFTDLELIVVIDGPDDVTVEALKTVDDPRLRWVQHERNMGISAARNTGFREAKGDYIALQDDDDEWMPEKIKKQVAACEAAGGEYVFSFCRYIERTGVFENFRPEEMPKPTDTGRRFVEYMFCHRGLLVPSIVMVSRKLAEKYPFDLTLQPAEDTDFFIRCMSDPEVKLATVSEALAVHNNYPPPVGAYRMSGVANWRTVLGWAIRQRSLFTGRAFAFLLTRGVTQFANDQNATLREKLSILMVALRLGAFSPRALMYFFASAFLTKQTKHRIRRMISPAARRHSVRVAEEHRGARD